MTRVSRMTAVDGIVEEILVEPRPHFQYTGVCGPAELLRERAVPVVREWVESRCSDRRRRFISLHSVWKIGAPGRDLRVELERDAHQRLDVDPGRVVLSEESIGDAVADAPQGYLRQIVIPPPLLVVDPFLMF